MIILSVFYVAVPVFAQDYDGKIDLKKKIIKSIDSVEMFYVTNKKLRKTVSQLFYYSYYQGKVYRQQGIAVGSLLSGEYKLFYNDKLIERGEYINGLKSGDWREWHPNGTMKELNPWRKGLSHGIAISYNNKGEIIQQKKYSMGDFIETEKKKKIDKKIALTNKSSNDRISIFKKKGKEAKEEKELKEGKKEKVKMKEKNEKRERESKFKLENMLWWKKSDPNKSE